QLDMSWLEVKKGNDWKPLNAAYKVKERSSIVASYMSLLNGQLGTSYRDFGELLAAQVPPNAGSTLALTTLDPTNRNLDSNYAFTSKNGQQQVHSEPVSDWYEDRVSKWLAVNAPGLTLADIKYDGLIAPRRIDTIDQAWPEQVMFTANGSTRVSYV